MIQVTHAAKKFIADKIVLASIVDGCCFGHSYKFDFYSKPEDITSPSTIVPDTNIFVDDSSLPTLRDSTLDYIEREGEMVLDWLNPVESNRCACGKSVNF